MHEKTASEVFPDIGTWTSSEHVMGDNDWCGCVLGDGIAEPKTTDISLTHPVLADTTHGVTANSKIDKTWSFYATELPNESHPNHIKCTLKMTFKYTPDVQAYNLTELGLCIFASSTSFSAYEKYWAGQITASDSTKYWYSYILLTHALFKDVSGNATTVSLDVGDVLTLNYYLDYYIDIRTHKGEITLKRINKDKSESVETYEYTCSLLGNISYAHSEYDCFLPSPPVVSNLFTYSSVGSLNKMQSIGLLMTLTEEELPTSDFANFNIDNYTAGLLDYRNHVFAGNGTNTKYIDYTSSDSTWDYPNIGSGSYTRYKRLVLGLFKHNEYLDTLAQSEDYKKWFYNSYEDLKNSSSHTLTYFLASGKDLSYYTSYVYPYPYTKPSTFLNNTDSLAYGNFSQEKDPDLYSLYLPFASTTRRAIVRYTYPTFNTGEHYVTQEDESKDRYHRTFLIATPDSMSRTTISGYSGYYVGKDTFRAVYAIVFANKETKRGIKINSNEFFQWGLESSIEKWTGE